MRVIMVTPSYYPIKGGTETIARNLSILLNKKGVQTDVMTFNMDRRWNPKWKGKIEKIDGITVYKIPALNWLPIIHSPRITLGVNLIPGRFMYIFKEYDIIHFHEADFSFPLFSFPARKPKIFHLHGFDVDFFKKYHLSRFILKHVANFYISLSDQASKDLMDLGIPEGKILHLPHGVDVKLFYPKNEKEDNLILFVGRITFIKGLHVLLESLHYLEKSCHLVIIGPPDYDLEYCQNVLNTVKRINLNGKHKITYLGALDREDIVEWYQKASVFVLPSFTEAFGIVILESFSCETPVVATSVGGVPEIVRNYENGILVPPNNALKLAEALQYLLENKSERTRMGKEGRKLVKRKYSLETISKRLDNIYQTVLTRQTMDK